MENNKAPLWDEKLPVSKLFPLGMQHVLAMYAGALAVPIIVGTALGLTQTDIAFLIAADLFTCGLATLLQTLGIGKFVGTKLPALMGCSFVSVGPMISIGNAAGGGHNGLTVVYGAVISAGIMIMIFAGVFGKLIKFFPPVVTGTVIMCVGLSLLPTAINNAAGGVGKPGFGSTENLILAGITLLVVLISNKFFTGFLQSISVLIGLVVGTILGGFMGMLDFTEAAHASWFSIVIPFHFGMPQFDPMAIVSMTLVAFVIAIEAIGVFLGLGDIANKPIGEKEITRGIRGEGLAQIIGGVMNSFPYATFSQNVGLVALSGVSSRWVCVMAGGILVFLGVIPKIAAVGTAIPMCVLGGATLAMFGMVAVSGMKILQTVDFSKNGNMLVVAVSLGIGLGFKFAPDSLANMNSIVHLLLGDGIVATSILALVLNAVFNWDDIKSGASEKAALHH